MQGMDETAVNGAQLVSVLHYPYPLHLELDSSNLCSLRSSYDPLASRRKHANFNS